MNREDAKNAKKIIEAGKRKKPYLHLSVLRAFAVFSSYNLLELSQLFL